MASPNTPFRVLIAGGGIAGLTLALMLQATNIDFLMLEAYADPAPQAGASIGFLPHGLRILDQLGVHNALAEYFEPVDCVHFRNQRGELLVRHEGVAAACRERHGYPMAFLDRQIALRIFYERIRDKSRVLTRKRVATVHIAEDGVTVTTHDGSKYSADILVGADGVHSQVRREMVRIAAGEQPGYFPAEECHGMPYDYACIFGISKPCPGVRPGDYTSVFRKKSSYVVFGGRDGRIFWFVFLNVGKRLYYGSQIPRYTETDMVEILERHKSDPIQPGLRLGELVQRKIVSNMTPLPEYTFRKWHYRRVITIGDAAHKFHPNAGHGGNAAVETAATLVNNLVKTLFDGSCRRSTLSSNEITSIFRQVQETRHARVEKLIADSHHQQRVESLDNLYLEFVALHILPRTDTEDILFDLSKNIPQAQKLDVLPAAVKPLLIPHHNDFPTPPRPRGRWDAVFAGAFLALSVWAMRVRSGVTASGETYTGNQVIDERVDRLVGALLPGVSGSSVLVVYCLISLFVLVAVCSVEACRKRNALTLLSFPTLWFLLSQTLSPATIFPLYSAAYMLVSIDETYWWPLTREVPAHYAKTLLPSLIIGFLLPTVAMFFWSHSDMHSTKIAIAVWTGFPIYISVVLYVASRIYSFRHPPPQTYRTPSASLPLPDMEDLKRLYALAFGGAVAAHVAMVGYGIYCSSQSLEMVILFGTGDDRVWRVHVWIFFLATLGWELLAIWDLKRVGRSQVDFARAAGMVVLGNVGVGPGAALVAVWWWREQCMARTVFCK